MVAKDLQARIDFIRFATLDTISKVILPEQSCGHPENNDLSLCKGWVLLDESQDVFHNLRLKRHRFRLLANAPRRKAELDVETFAQLLLKFVVGHPAVTVAIPSTLDPHHMAENLAAGRGPIPDEKQRAKIAAIWA